MNSDNSPRYDYDSIRENTLKKANHLFEFIAGKQFEMGEHISLGYRYEDNLHVFVLFI